MKKMYVNLQNNAKMIWWRRFLLWQLKLECKKHKAYCPVLIKGNYLTTERTKWSLSELRLQPTTKVAYILKAKETTIPISGPKTGKSKT
ncbi:hypothetical protein [Candidatus Kuenenia stuttgartiensis]|uniref:hypothetical protein n=1 Tax=Kuenenia stuttgartiensis TaxID=174633 RepID=UPI00146D90AF|nr:hypothetical protein [Candidatus Kuenenia stuttgartiensis]